MTYGNQSHHSGYCKRAAAFRNTVSKAINNTGVLADATREKILRKAAEMGYKQFAYLPLFQEDLLQKQQSIPFCQ